MSVVANDIKHYKNRKCHVLESTHMSSIFIRNCRIL